ncbi:hypothetical protein [Primorskyibacter marinus]|uniref:hypothetical protein n=1 Tax=Primorskyibacter marinus TaxID=1977320 RepID=UPI000E309BE0|nr:hypothetical protein [Primorskyibacter marinus]
MQNTTTIDTEQVRYDAVADTQKHLRQHGASLCDLLDALDDPAGFEAFCVLHSGLAAPFPDADTVNAALRDIRRIIAAQSASLLERISRERNLYAAEAAHWHGARLSDLIARFRHVG